MGAKVLVRSPVVVENNESVEETFVIHSPADLSLQHSMSARCTDRCTQSLTMVDEALLRGDISVVTEMMNGDGSFIPPFSLQPPASGYTRNLLWRTPQFALMALVWAPGAQSPIHAHGGSRCWVRVLQGSLTETLYSVTSSDGDDVQLKEMSKEAVNTGSFSYVDDGIGVHDMTNNCVGKGGEAAVSLHLYAPPFESCDVYRQVDGAVVIEQASMTFHTVFEVPQSV